MTSDKNLIKNKLRLLQLASYHIAFRRKIYMKVKSDFRARLTVTQI